MGSKDFQTRKKSEFVDQFSYFKNKNYMQNHGYVLN